MPIERALFVVGPQNAGKSKQLRAMFLDWQLQNGGKILTAKKIPETYRLSNERRLHLRLTSPHEYGETPDEWLNKIGTKTQGGRWCVADALQPNAENKMPDVVAAVLAFMQRFDPERIRVIFLSPTWKGDTIDNYAPGVDLVSSLLAEDIEVATVDARSREGNGLFLADFFDFT